MSLLRNDLYHVRRSAQCCGRCGTPSLRSLCPTCAVNNTTTRAVLRRLRQSRGQCTHCGDVLATETLRAVPEGHKASCAECLLVRRVKQAERRRVA